MIPDQKEYSEDELEIWLYGKDTRLCLYKDSFHHSFLQEVTHVVNFFLKSRTENEDVVAQYHSLIDADDSLSNYLLLENSGYCTFLSCTGQKKDAQISVFRVSPECILESPPVVSEIIDRHSFLIWFQSIITALGTEAAKPQPAEFSANLEGSN